MKHFVKNHTLNEALNILNSDKLEDGASWPPDSYHTASWDNISLDSFYGGVGWKGALERATKGDQVLLAQIDKMAEKIQSECFRPADPVVEYNRGCAGDSIDMGLYMSGEPECMYEATCTIPDRPIVDIVVQVNALAGVRADTLARKGAGVFACIRALELQGYSVGITAVRCVRDGNAKHIHTVVLKQPEEYLDPAVAAFWLAHPSGFRRLFFRLAEYYKPMPCSYGSTSSIPEKYRKPGQIVIGPAMPNTNKWTSKRWGQWVQEQFAEQGIQFDGLSIE